MTNSVKWFGSVVYCSIRNMWHFARLSHVSDSKDNGDGLLTDGCCGEIWISKTNCVLCQIFSNNP